MRNGLPRLLLIFLFVLPCICGCSIGHQYGHIDPEQLGDFPTDWPPPNPSTHAAIPDTAFANASTVGDAMGIIAGALKKAGYSETSYFSTKDGGVALVTRLERFAEDGSTLPDGARWSGGRDSERDLLRMFRKMYLIERGRYRVFVFVLGPAFSSTPRLLTRNEVEGWVTKGIHSRLPQEVAERPLRKAGCTVYVYEFESTGDTVRYVNPAPVPAELQLQRNGVLASLGQAR